MQLSLALFALLPALALAAPSGVTQQLENRQGGVADNCGGKSYTASQVNQAIRNALSGKYDSSGYPHTYNVSSLRLLSISPADQDCVLSPLRQLQNYEGTSYPQARLIWAK